MSSAVPATPPLRFNRHELKYQVGHREAGEFLERLGGHVRPDPNAGPQGFYKVVSRYYDSPDLDWYWEKIDGQKFRRKIRVRTYGEGAGEGFVEIKQRLIGNVQKRRLRAPLAEIEVQMAELCAGRYRGGVHPVYDEACALFQRYRFRPQVIVSYNRAAFFAVHARDLRLTLDRNLRCRHLDLSLTKHRLRGRFMLPPDQLILEVKFNEALPRWLAVALNSMDLQMQRISKYCLAVERAGLVPP